MIDKILHTISRCDRDTLLVALQSNLSYTVSLRDREFICVNNPMLGDNNIILYKEGPWIYGKYK